LPFRCFLVGSESVRSSSSRWTEKRDELVPDLLRSPQIASFVPAGVLFHDSEATAKSLVAILSSMDRSACILMCGRLSHILSGGFECELLERHERAAMMVLSPAQVKKVNQYHREQRAAGPPVVFFRAQLLELARWAAEYAPDGTASSLDFGPGFKQCFLKAAMMAGELWSKWAFRSDFGSTGNRNEDRERALPSFRLGTGAAAEAPGLSRIIGRASLIVGRHLVDVRGSFVDEFAQATGLSVQDYLAYMACILMQYQKIDQPFLFEVEAFGAQTQHHKELGQFLELVSQTPDDMKRSLWTDDQRKAVDGGANAAWDPKSLIERPVITTRFGIGVVIDPVLFADAFMCGPLFRCIPVVESVNGLFGDYGIALERYCQTLLRRMYPETQSLVRRLETNLVVPGTVYEVDALVSCDPDFVVVECKAAFAVHAATISSSPDAYREFLLKKYGVSKGSERDRKIKGVGQLARVIRLGVERKIFGDGPSSSSPQILPVLLVQDESMTAAGHARFLSEAFRDAIDGVVGSGLDARLGDFHVHPLIVMTVGDLENLETSSEHFAMADILRDYSNHHSDRNISLHDYMATSRYSGSLLHSRSLAEAGMEVLRRVETEVFGLQGTT